MAKFFVTTIIATALILGSVGLFMLPAPQGSDVWLVLTMNPVEKVGVMGIIYPSVNPVYPTSYPSVKPAGLIMHSTSRVGLIMR